MSAACRASQISSAVARASISKCCKEPRPNNSRRSSGYMKRGYAALLCPLSHPSCWWHRPAQVLQHSALRSQVSCCALAAAEPCSPLAPAGKESHPCLHPCQHPPPREQAVHSPGPLKAPPKRPGKRAQGAAEEQVMRPSEQMRCIHSSDPYPFLSCHSTARIHPAALPSTDLRRAASGAPRHGRGQGLVLQSGRQPH